jgi:hypothetical protein
MKNGWRDVRFLDDLLIFSIFLNASKIPYIMTFSYDEK